MDGLFDEVGRLAHLACSQVVDDRFCLLVGCLTARLGMNGLQHLARALLRWSVLDLAEASKVGVATIRRVEVVDGPIPVTAANEAALRNALEAAGIQFIDENGGGAGVRFRKPRER